MTVAEWFEAHKDVGFTIDNPKTRAGHKTDIEMWSLNRKGVKAFRESITYGKPTEMQIISLLDSMYEQIKRIETTNSENNQ